MIVSIHLFDRFTFFASSLTFFWQDQAPPLEARRGLDRRSSCNGSRWLYLHPISATRGS